MASKANNITKEELYRLLRLYEQGMTSPEETLFVQSYYEWFAGEPDLTDSLSETEEAALKEKMFALITAANEEEENKQTKVVPFWKRVSKLAVAAAIILIAASTYLIIQNSKGKNQNTELTQQQRFKNDVAPGRKGSKIKLDDGRTILTDTMRDGLIAVQGGMQVWKENGEIVYKGTSNTKEILYNEVIADIGHYTSVRLPDGSIAWVNAGSSIRYPLNFDRNERKVTMTGEAAFKVVHNENNPFRVYAGGQVFEDKGTVFNVRAYNDEPVIKTTVLEGLVNIGTTQIKPSQQAQVTKNGTVKLVESVNTEAVFAWRDGEFSFSNAGIEEILNDAAKWYGVDVVYQEKTNQRFGFVGIDRNMPISNLLKNLEASGGVHFEIEGKKVIVKK